MRVERDKVLLCMEKIKDFFKMKYEQIVPLIHFALTFVWERAFFVFSDNWNCWYTDIKDKNAISNFGENCLVYFIAKAVSFIIIYLVWKMIFRFWKKCKLREDRIILLGIFITGIACLLIVFPGVPEIGLDNYTNYLFARRFLPTYWHSVYTGILYTGCLMALPHPMMIHIFQWFFYWITVSFVYLKVQEFYGNTLMKLFPMLLLLLPESYYLIFVPYRNNYYTVLLLAYISYIYFEAKRGEHTVTGAVKVLFVITSAFVMVWRSEGILFGIAGTLVYMMCVLRYGRSQWRRILLMFAGLILSFVFLNKVQSLGSEKYYGRDYMIINSTNVLQSIFNAPDSNLTYRNAEYDLNNINEVIPIEALREYGMEGFRKNNWSEGRLDFNQTLASDSAADMYMKSYYRIILHNLNIYLDVQINNLFESLQMPATHKVYLYDGEPQIDLKDYEYDIWQKGLEEVRQSYGTASWERNKVRRVLSSLVIGIISVWRELITASGINRIMHALTLMADCLIPVIEFVRWIRDKEKKHLIFILTFVMIIGECMAVTLFMPEGRPAYMYPVLYSGYLLSFIFWLENHSVSTKV